MLPGGVDHCTDGPTSIHETRGTWSVMLLLLFYVGVNLGLSPQIKKKIYLKVSEIKSIPK
jgi:hypothetical protein